MPINTTITCTGDYQEVGGGSVYAQGFVFILNGPVDIIMQYGDATGNSQNVGFQGLEAGQYSLAQGEKYGIIGFQVRAAGGSVSSPAQTFQFVASEPNIPIIVPVGAGIGNPFSSNLEVTDGVTTVDPAQVLDFTSGATVTDLGGGVAGVVTALSFEHNDATVATEPAADFEDSTAAGGGIIWTLINDPTNGRVKIAAQVKSSIIPASISFPVSNNDIEGDNKWNFPGSVCLDQNGNLIAAFSKGTSEVVAGKICIAQSSDNGATWTTTTLYTPPANTSYNVGGIILTGTGRLIITGFTTVGGLSPTQPQTLWRIYSDDNGSTWTSMTTISGFSGFSATAGWPITNGAGNLLWPIYGQNTGDSKDRAGLLQSTDNGVTWPTFIAVGPANQDYNELSIAIDVNNVLYAFIRNDTNFPNPSFVYRSVSHDNGATWSTLSPLSFNVTAGLPAAIIQPNNQALLLSYRQAGANEYPCYRYSFDYGITWTAEATYTTGGTYGYAGGIAISSGELGFLLGQIGSPTQIHLAYVEAIIVATSYGNLQGTLDLVENTSGTITVTATSDGNGNGQTIISGNPVTYDGNTEVLIEFSAYAADSAAGTSLIVNVYEGTTDLGRICNTGQNITAPLRGGLLLKPTSGPHTYSIKAWKSGSGAAHIYTGTGGASTAAPGWYRVSTT